jgi:excisionase family DNA binding protein
MSGASQTAAAAERQQQSRAAVLLLTVPQAAEMLAVGRSTVYGLISGGALNSVRVGGSRRIPVHALEAYIASLLPVQQSPLPAADR